ncbi:hypothetical protein [Fuerstiella marisgermanici]|uniref:Polyketide synthase n=1 Tax=Fuerstiella marisgermanici TaxID=1891926 RepID=A0A1P8WRT9_9PLAN|nr:hypothetical protein [Fuerstiella marisgermanici]APZ96774.1 hypothetical protein Fuma_06448 [Fuerstiella marisgermanici]
MSSTTVNPQRPTVQLPDALRDLIAAMRSRLRRYSLISGTLAILTIGAIAFWLTSGIDAGWFALQRLELPGGLRWLLLVLMIAGGLWLLVQHLLRPLLRRTRDAELALLLERRFPQFQDRLITAVENRSGYPDDGPLVGNMLDRTVQQAESVAANVSPDDVFNFAPLKKRSWIAGVLVLSIAGSAFARPGSLQRWWNAFVLQKETYHLRTTALDFSVVAQPGDRRMAFRENENRPLYLHPRGADLELEMTVPDGNSETGDPWVVPERVRVDVIRFDGNRSRTYVSPTSERSFRFILTRLQETVEIEVLAGDYRTPVPLRIEAVTPPSINGLEAECIYPEYTGWNQQRESLVPIMGSEVSLPVGTSLKLTATSNKPLKSARITTDFFEVVGDRESTELIPRQGYSVIEAPTSPLISEDGLAMTASFRVSLAAADSDSAPDEQREGEPVTADGFQPVPSNTSLRFLLHDEDDIISTSPESLRIRGIPDKPPVIATRVTGVDNAITRRAIVPVTGIIQDDYGLETARFEYIVDDETTWRTSSFKSPVSRGTTEHELGSAADGTLERFNVSLLDLTEGQTLALGVVATDQCSIPDPNSTRAEPIVFRIVSNEELLSLLYTRELNLRRRFEDVIQQLQLVREDLEFHKDVAVRVEAAGDAEANSEDRIGLTTAATRSGNNLRRQNNEMESIVEAFDEIGQQLVNNAIPPQQLAQDMKTDIIDPLQKITKTLMMDADRSVSRFRVAVTSGKPASQLADQSVKDVSNVIAELKLILEKVRDMAEFHEIYQEGKYILEDLLKNWEETRELQKKRAIEKLQLLE